MILLISAQQPQLDGSVDERFGRSPWLIKYHSNTKQWNAFPNPGASQSNGAGVAAAQFAIDQHVNVVISGDFGPHASSAFQAAEIDMHLFTYEVSKVSHAVELFLQGKLPVFK